MGFFDWLGGNADTYRVLGPDGKPVNQLPQSTFNATPMQGMGAANPALGNAQDNYGQQQNYINLLQGQANGTGPSVAQELLRQQTGANNQNAASLIASQRGMNPGLAAKLATDQAAAQQQQAAGQGATLRAQEMTSGRSMLGSALGQQAQSNLGAGNLALGQQGQELGNYWNAQQLNQQTAGQNAGLMLGAEGLNAGAAQSNASNNPFAAILGGALNGAGGAMSMKGGGGGGASAAGLGSELLPIALSSGGDIPGRAAVSGDSPKNDTVHAELSPHEIVLPRSVTLADDAPERARDFVRAIKGRIPRKKTGYSEGGEAPDPLDSPGSFSPSSTTAAFFGGHTAMTSPQVAAPSATQPPEMLAAPDSVTAPEDPLAPSVPWGNSDTGGVAGRGPSLDFKPTQATPTGPTSAALAEQGAGVKQEIKGLQGEAGAAQEHAKSQTQIMDSWNGAQAELRAKFQEAMQAHQQKSDALFNSLMDPKNDVQANRFWEQASTGSKISASIGMILGGIGAGLTHGPNYAAENINKAIDRDIEAQKLNVGKKENLLSQYMQQGRDMQQAHALASADMKDAAAAQLARAAAAYQGTNAGNVAQVQIGQLRQQAAAQRQQVLALDYGNQERALSMQYMRWQMQAKADLTGGGGQRVNPEMLDKDTRERVVEMPTGDQRLAPSSKDAEQVRESLQQTDSLQATINEMRDFMKQGSSLPLTERNARAQTLRARMVAQVNHVAGVQRLSERDIELLNDQIPDPGAFMQGRSAAKLDELQKLANQNMVAHMRAHIEGGTATKMPGATRRAGGE